MNTKPKRSVTEYLAEIGRLGGKAKSPAKTRAAQRNARKPRKGKLS